MTIFRRQVHHEPKAHEDVLAPVEPQVGAAVVRRADFGARGPAAAAHHAEEIARDAVLAVQAPLPDVPVHVIESPAVGRVGPDLGVFGEAALAVRVVAEEPSDPPQVVRRVAVRIGPRRTGPAGVFPLDFRRQIEGEARARAQQADEPRTVNFRRLRPGMVGERPADRLPRHALDRTHLALEAGRIPSRHPLILPLRHCQDTKRDRPSPAAPPKDPPRNRPPPTEN